MENNFTILIKTEKKKEVNRVSIPKDILKDFEESADEYEDKKTKRKKYSFSNTFSFSNRSNTYLL